MLYCKGRQEADLRWQTPDIQNHSSMFTKTVCHEGTLRLSKRRGVLFSCKGGNNVTLEEFFAAAPEVAIAFSGGVDSAYLLYAAMRHARRVQAYTVQSAFQPCFELEDARRLAAQLGAPLTIVPLDVLAVPGVAENGADRCYHCKRAVLAAVLQAARCDGFSVLCDGTNADDDAADRPGMRALAELDVRSPLRDCGLTKASIRQASRDAGLFTWDKPAYACLATRQATGEPLTTSSLAATEAAESALAALGFRDFRVRAAHGHARIQVPETQLAQVLSQRTAILAALRPLYHSVSLDLEVRP